MTKISVVIPCYNYAHYLSETIESVLNQTCYEDIEIIVVDDGSTDNTEEVALKYPVRYILQDNMGLSGARNTGIRSAIGEYIYPLDADDMIVENCLERCLDKMLKEKVDIVCPGLQEFGDSHAFQIGGENLNLNGFIKSNQIHACSLYKKSMWQDIGGYDEEMREGLEDYAYWIKAVMKGYKFLVIDEPMFFYRVHGDSMIHRTLKKHEEIKSTMLKKLKLI